MIFSKFEQLSNPKFTKNQSSASLKLPKMTFLDRLNLPKLDFTWNRRDGKIIKFLQSQALTSHFESFWSMVYLVNLIFNELLKYVYLKQMFCGNPQVQGKDVLF